MVVDWVPNHSSDRHEWFLESRSSRESPRRDWYVWHDGDGNGGPPNDWMSEFPAGRPRVDASTTATEQWYLHSFMAEQPDLNWDNPEVEAAMHDTLRFWLDRGVDGFRVDALQRLAHDPLLRPNAGAARRRDQDWDTMHERLRGIRRVADEYEDRMLVGEVALARPAPRRELPQRRRPAAPRAQLRLLRARRGTPRRSGCRSTTSRRWRPTAPGRPGSSSNHDRPRVATRFDDGTGHGPARARAALLMLYALRGTPFVYQGEELGLPDAEIPPDRVVDVDGRDPERAPIPWRPPSAAGPGAGFTTGEPWLPLVGGAEALNAETQAADPRSTLSLDPPPGGAAAGHAGAAARRAVVRRRGDDVLAWVREADGDRPARRVNFAAAPVPLAAAHGLPGRRDARSCPPIPPAPAGTSTLAGLVLAPGEGVLLRL